MSDQKIKSASGKVPLDLVPLASIKGAARVFGYGAKKYAKGNWYTATDDEFGARYAGGALRHLADAQRPDGTFDFESLAALDVESGLPEIDHMLCGLMMLRGLLIKRGVLPADPGIGKDPPAASDVLAKDAKARYEALIANRVAQGGYDIVDAEELRALNKECAKQLELQFGPGGVKW